jgi:hypothetical protein
MQQRADKKTGELAKDFTANQIQKSAPLFFDVASA